MRIDTPQEVLYYQHGGILQYVLAAVAANCLAEPATSEVFSSRTRFAFSVLIGLTPLAMAQYGVIKVDLNQVSFADLLNPGGGGGGKIPVKGFPGKEIGIKQMDPLASTEGDGLDLRVFRIEQEAADQGHSKISTGRRQRPDAARPLITHAGAKMHGSMLLCKQILNTNISKEGFAMSSSLGITSKKQTNTCDWPNGP